MKSTNKFDRGIALLLSAVLTVSAAGVFIASAGEAADLGTLFENVPGVSVVSPQTSEPKENAPQTRPTGGRRVVRRRVRRAAPGAPRTPRIFAGGAGTEKSPYQIRTAEQFAAFATSVNEGNSYSGKFIRLGADIDLAGASRRIPVGFSNQNATRPFRGVFDGAGYNIWNFRSEGGLSGTALFGAVENAILIRVSLQSVSVVGDGNAGGLVAFLHNSAVKNCSVSGSVEGSSSVGGIVGSALAGVVENSVFTGSVKGKNSVGGLIGVMDQTVLRSNSVSGRVEGIEDVGGAVGGILAGVLVGCSTDALIVTGSEKVGGLVGSVIDSGEAVKSAFDGQVTGKVHVGGIVGRMMAGSLAGCSASGTLQGEDRVGGIAGELIDGGISECTSNAQIVGMTQVGGVAGRLSGGSVTQSGNRGAVKGGEAVGGLIGSLAGGELSGSQNLGTVKGYRLTGDDVGVREKAGNRDSAMGRAVAQ